MTGDQQTQSVTGPQGGSLLGTAMSWVGALTSVALIAGLAVWGYKLTVRDVSGVPVVRALEGPMRVQPAEPGGQEAPHQGLAVNAVQAEGVAEAPAERLVLAPAPLDLNAAAPQPRPLADDETPLAEAEEAPLTAGTVEAALVTETEDEGAPDAMAEALAEALSDGVEPLTPLAEEAESGDRISSEIPGVKRSPRPNKRPERDLTQAQAGVQVQGVALASAPAASATEIDAGAVPAGTRLVQLGAFDSEDIARREWDKLVTQFGPYMEEKSRVIQKATSGGRTFFRLRAMGFADIGDARRFCSALLAENAACIPVVAR